MQTFRVFLKILKKNIPAVMIYVTICIIMVFLVGSTNAEEGVKLYKNSEIPFTVIDRDGGMFGDAIKEYLSEKNEYKEMDDNTELLRNNLFYRSIGYALIIPEGYEESVLSGNPMELKHMKVEDSVLGYYVDMEVNQFMMAFNSYIAAGYGIEDALASTADALKDSVEVKMSDKSTKSWYNKNYYYYEFLPYVIMSTIITAVGPAYIAFNRRDLRRRVNCSAMGFKSRNVQLALGAAVVGISICIMLNVMAAVVYNGNMSSVEILFNVLNTMCMSVISLGIAFLCGNMVKNTEILAAVVNVLGLGLSFFGGVFVPLEVLSETMHKFSKITPTYWYVNANNAIVGAEKFSDLDTDKIFFSFGIQLLFAAAIFGIALVIVKKFRTRD